MLINKTCITLPAVYCRSFASEVVFWAILKISSSLFTTVPLNRRTRVVHAHIYRYITTEEANRESYPSGEKVWNVLKVKSEKWWSCTLWITAVSINSFNTRPTNPWTCIRRFAILFSCFTLSVACRTDYWYGKRLWPVSKGSVFRARRENCKYFKTFFSGLLLCKFNWQDGPFSKVGILVNRRVGLFDQFFVINPVQKLLSSLCDDVLLRGSGS